MYGTIVFENFINLPQLQSVCETLLYQENTLYTWAGHLLSAVKPFHLIIINMLFSPPEHFLQVTAVLMLEYLEWWGHFKLTVYVFSISWVINQINKFKRWGQDCENRVLSIQQLEPLPPWI